MITIGIKNETDVLERVLQAQKEHIKANEQPTWAEAWEKVFKLKTVTESELNRQRAIDVKNALEAGELGFNEPLKKLSFAKVKELYDILTEKRKKEIIADLIRNKPENYHLIQREKEFQSVIKDLSRETLFSLDTETTGLDVFNDRIVGICLTLPKSNYHVYIPVEHLEGIQLSRDYVLHHLYPYLQNRKIGKVLHNARYDLHMFLRHGVGVKGVVHDTLIAMAILNENEESFALKNLGTKYARYLGFDKESYTYEQLFGRGGFEKTPLDVAVCYAAKDTHLTHNLYKWQMNIFKERQELYKLYKDIENPLIEVCVEMEQTGFLIDMKYAKKYSVILKAQIEDLESKLKIKFGDINFNSPQQLKKVLYEDLGLPDLNDGSTDVKTLKQLATRDNGIEDLLKYREYAKLLGTYVDALPDLVKSDKRIHGSFNQVATVTGRFSSNNPNLQNLPPEARHLIIAPKGKAIVGIDFSQIEPRVLAHISGDRKLQEPYLKGQDLYSTLASQVFRKPFEECLDGSKWRKSMKTGLLAVMYGTSMFTLSGQLGITIQEAEQFIEDFYATYPDVHKWILSIHGFVKENEYVTTMFGRKRRFPGHKQKAIIYDALYENICKRLGTKKVPHDFWKYKELPYKLKREFQDVKGSVEAVRRQAVNAIIQGSAADIMKLALLNLYQYCKRKNWQVNGTVHDEALLQVDRYITEAEIREIEKCMTSTVKLSVPLKVDTEIMLRWGKGRKKGAWFKLAAWLQRRTLKAIA